MGVRARISEVIERKKSLLIQASDQIWELSETRFEEFQSARLLSDILDQEGFKVEHGVGGIETAFMASYGEGYPVIAVLGEYDALPSLSQKAGVFHHEELVEGGNGHGCGHNLLGVGALGAVFAIKQLMEEQQLQGTIRYYGCPGEEGGSGKTFMVREGLFDDVDIALTWHPGDHNLIMEGRSLANYQVYYQFKGTSSHAAISPHLGRSALDAVELMNVGVNYLREHVIPEAKIHYAVTNTGGNSPNVVQAEAEVLYLIRAPRVQQVEEIFQRINHIAQGSALMTETSVNIKFDKACSNLIPNQTLNQIFYRNFNSFGVPIHTEEEQLLAWEMKRTFKPKKKADNKPADPRLKDKVLSDYLQPYCSTEKEPFSASTDVGDVSWVVPTAQCQVACYALGTQYHTWQMVAQGKTLLGYKGMLHASKVIASTALELFMNPELIEEAKLELKEAQDGEEYVCPIPQEVKPSAFKRGMYD